MRTAAYCTVLYIVMALSSGLMEIFDQEAYFFVFINNFNLIKFFILFMK